MKAALAEIERLQESLGNITATVTRQRTDLPEADVIATIQVMRLRLAQLKRLLAIEGHDEPIDQACYDALLIELHRQRNQ